MSMPAAPAAPLAADLLPSREDVPAISIERPAMPAAVTDAAQGLAERAKDMAGRMLGMPDVHAEPTASERWSAAAARRG